MSSTLRLRDRRARTRRASRWVLLALVALSATVYVNPAGGQPVGTSESSRSSPPDLTHPRRPAVPAETTRPLAPIVPAPGVFVVDPAVDNTVPNFANTDTIGGTEPFVARNPVDPNEIVVTAFSGSWGTNAPVWHSANGGTTWTKRFTIPVPPGRNATGCPCDQTIDYDRAGNLFGTFLINGGNIVSGDTTDPTSAAAWQWRGNPVQITNNAHQGNGDQPWLVVNRDPVTAAQDDTYVAYDDFGTGPTGQVAVSQGVRPPDFTIDNPVGPVGGTTNPAFRLNTDPRNGTIYAVFERSSGNTQPKNITYVLNRSTDGGVTWTLNGSATGINIDTVQSDQAPGVKFGTVNALLGGIDHVAVDPTTGDVYVVYGADIDGTGTQQNQLFIRRLTNNGAGGLTVGPRFLVSTSTDAALPSVAVTTDGTVGVLYHTFDGFSTSGNLPMFSAHFSRSTDRGVTFNDVVLEQFLSPVTDNGDGRQRILGDYQVVKTLGRDFYGTFSGNRVPFNGATGTSIIDPIYFSVTGNLPPVCSAASTSPNRLWPANHMFRTVTIGGITDPDGDPLTVTITAVTQDEPVKGSRDANTSPDARRTTLARSVLLRAERSALGDGRVYRVTFTATDPNGASCSGVVKVGVPRDQDGRRIAVDSAPPSYNSFTP
jgi:hypothetical protein